MKKGSRILYQTENQKEPLLSCIGFEENRSFSLLSTAYLRNLILSPGLDFVAICKGTVAI